MVGWVGVLVAASGALLTIAYEWNRAPVLAPAKAETRGGARVAAFYLGQTGDSLVLAAGLCEPDKTTDLGQAILLARSEIVELTLEKQVHVDDRAAKREAWQALGVCGAVE